MKRADTREFEKALNNVESRFYKFQLYVAGTSPLSLKAIRNLKSICDRYLEGQYQINVIDINQHTPETSLLAVPMVIKKLPLPIKKMIGDMSNTSKVLLALNLITAEAT